MNVGGAGGVGGVERCGGVWFDVCMFCLEVWVEVELLMSLVG